jgi:hypothetical protein
MKLKGRCFETVSDILRELQAVLDNTKENDFYCAFEAWKNYEIAVYVPNETILKEMTYSWNFPIHLLCLNSPFVGPWPHFQFLNPIHSRYDTLDGGSARRKAANYKQNTE